MMGKFWRLLENLIVAAAFVAIIGFVVNLLTSPAEATPSVGVPVYCDNAGDHPHDPFRCLDMEQIESEICDQAYRRVVRGDRTTLDHQNIVLGCLLTERIKRLESIIRQQEKTRRWNFEIPLGSVIR